MYHQWLTCGQAGRLMCKYDDVTLDPIPPTLASGEKKHILVPQDECIVNIGDQQPLKKKGNRHAIHICSWICETTRHLKLSNEQIATQSELPKVLHLMVTDSCKTIYPGKIHNPWWDLKQLMDQMKHIINIFEYLHPDKVGIWLFNCSSACEGLTEDVLNINNMNVNPGGKQQHLHSTIIPTNNPPPKPGYTDTQGQHQGYDVPCRSPRPKAPWPSQGYEAVLQECESVWEVL